MMKNNDELLEQKIKEEFEREAKEEEAALQEDHSISVPTGVKEALYLKICGEMEKIEREEKIKEKAGTEEEIEENVKTEERIEEKQPDNLYANMSEEDRKALEIGRRILEEAARSERGGNVVRKAVRKKRRIKVYVGVAAALVLAMAVGLTSMGGPEKIIKMMRRAVGSMEVEQVDSGENNKVIEEDESNAYQKVSEEFGVEPVRLVIISENMKFVNMKFDEVLQTAELYYEYNGNKLSYLISASHKKAAFGLVIADEVVKEYTMEVHGKEIEIKKYQVSGEEVEKYSASFKEMGLKYSLYGIMEQPEFELLVENLHFLW